MDENINDCFGASIK